MRILKLSLTPLALALCVAGLLAMAAASHQAHALTNCNAPADTNASAEAQMLTLINGARAAVGAPALKFSPNLQRAALWKSADSSAYGPGFSHTDSLGRTTVSEPDNRAVDCGYATYAGEDIAYGFPTVDATFEAWMHSPEHYANIVDPHAVVIGIGEVIQDGTPCWTADFGAVDDSQQPGETPDNAQPAPVQASDVSSQGSTQGYSTQLYSGLNFVAFQGQSESIEAATQGLGGSLLAVYAWDPQAQVWQAYFPGAPAFLNNINTMTPDEAYCIIMRTGMTWQY